VLEGLRLGPNGERQNERPLQQAHKIVRLPGAARVRGHTCADVHSSHPALTDPDERPQTHTEPASFGNGVSFCLPLFVPGCFCAQQRITFDWKEIASTNKAPVTPGAWKSTECDARANLALSSWGGIDLCVCATAAPCSHSAL
jgi:hypothetical protein